MSNKIENATISEPNIKMCCVCLSSDRKLYNMKEKDLYKQYIEFTDKNFAIDNLQYRLMCWECSARLTAAVRFKTNAILSQALLCQLLKSTKHEDIILVMSLIDNYKKKIKSNLMQTISEPNHTDYHFVYTESVIKKIEEYDIPVLKLEVDEPNFENISRNEDIIKNEDKTIVDEEENDNDETDYEEVAYLDITEPTIAVDKLNEDNLKLNEDNLKLKDDDDVSNINEDELNLNENFKDDNENTSSDETLIQVKVKKKRVRNVKTKIDKRRIPAHEVINTELFDIIDLPYVDQVNEIKSRQNSLNYKYSLLKCDKCYKGFVDKIAFNSHMNRHTEQGGPHKCKICEIRFKQTKALASHLGSHCQKFSCKKCSYVTARRHAAKMHEEFHNGTTYQCPHCFDQFSKKTTFLGHVRVKHPTDIVCEICGHSFVSTKGLIQHKALKHRFQEQTVPPDGPECSECNIKFINREALANHIRLSPKHINDKSNKKDLQPPKERKKGVPNKIRPRKVGPMQCEQCEMQLPDALSYFRHFRREHPGKNRTNYAAIKAQHMCEICGKMFQSIAVLKDHSSTHSDVKQFVCPICGKRFQRKYRLIAHKRLHVRQQKHACPVCASVFTTVYNMQRHMTSHSSLRPYKCEICDKGFKLASEKKNHVNSVHLKEPWPKKTRGKRKNKQNEAQSDEATEGT